ncbi:ribonuclease J [Terrisporobacter petrolearius]|uniref:ribonuclease J n=1 Tax=Terrisporobacter petrolearius TaxID=1460447 RepID=UPI0031CCD275
MQLFKKNTNKVKVMALGGLNEIGKNMTVIEYKDEIVVIDAGLSFPEDEMLGVDIVIPDITYLLKNKDKVKGIFITHGHEDHIGALPYILKKIDVPVYGTRLSIGLIEVKLKEHKLNNVKLNVVTPKQIIKLKNISVEFIKNNHSIPGSCSLAVHTEQGVIFHTGDFKIDLTPIDGDVMDIHRICELGSAGVLLMLADSTNVEKPGFTMSERTVGAGLDDLFRKANGSRIIVSTFASNIHRLQQIINTAVKFNRKVAVSGRSMVNVIGVAKELGYLEMEDDTLVDLNDLSKYDDKELVIITTGTQGEPMSALARMSSSEHKKVEIKKGDLVIISAHPIPGNEKLISKVINLLFERGARVVYNDIADIHVSGHAAQEDLKLINRMVKPKFFMPVHGEYRMLKRHAELANELGMPDQNVFVMQTGQVLELDRNSAKVTATVPTGNVLVDGLGVGDVGNIVLRDRKHLSEDGLMIVVVTISKEDGKVLAGPDIISRGFVYVRESEDLMDGAKKVIKDVLTECEEKNIKEWAYLKNNIKENLKEYLYIKTKRNPMILPIIMEV